MLISLHRAVPYAAIGMAIWFAMQWYIVRTQDKLWQARESSYRSAQRKSLKPITLHREQQMEENSTRRLST